MISSSLSGFTAKRIWPLLAVFLFLVCFIASAIIPPFQSPDEFAHIGRAYLLTKGQLVLDTPEGISSGGMIDTGLAAYMNAYEKLPSKPDIKLSSEEVAEANAIQWTGDKVFGSGPGTGYYFPLIYAPQAAGLIIGEALGISVDSSYRLARFSVLLSASLIVLAAFLIYAPSPLVVALLIIPMSIFQMSSASLDGISTAVSILAISAFMRITIEKGNSRPWLLHLLTASVMVVVSCRVHLLPLLLLVFGTFFYTRNVKSLITGVVASAFVAVWLAIAIKTTVDMRVVTGLSTSSIAYYYFTNPLSFIKLITATLANNDLSKFYAQSFFGVLGWLDARFSERTYRYLYALVFLTLILSVSFKNIRTEWPARALLVVCAVGSMSLVFFALLVTWNAHPATLIQGVQGRYFLVPALLVAYALNSNSKIESRLYNSAGIFLVFILLLFSSFITTRLLLDRYYISVKQPKEIKVERQVSPPLTRDQPIKLFMTQKQQENPLQLKGVSIMFGTHFRKNPGSAELRLTTKDGDNLVIPFDLPDLADNQYKKFNLDGRRYIAGEIVFSTGGGISVWEAHEETQLVSSCLIYELNNGVSRYTTGCPRP